MRAAGKDKESAILAIKREQQSTPRMRAAGKE